MKKQYFLIVSLLGFTTIKTAVAVPEETIGWIEQDQIQPEYIILTAKIDTGADNSSVHAQNIDVYEKDGNEMVKFSVENKDGDSAEFDLPLVRYTSIKRKGAESIMRPVVSMGLCIGNTLKDVEINLSNRKISRIAC